jgi:hypothetical protein
MSTYPKIVAFPDDEKIRVIWWYGPVFKNNSDSNVPKVLVLTRLLDENGVLTDQNQHFNINVTELELVRIGSIWKGRERQDDLYTAIENYRQNLEFTFNFNADEPESIPFDASIEVGKLLIPPFRYSLGDFKDKYVSRKQFRSSTLAKLESKHGITVLIPSLELLTSAIAPEHKLLRAHLLQHSIDQICTNYMSSGYEKDGAYVVESRNGYFRSNLTLLAYMKNNQTSRSRLSKIWASMQVGSSEYHDRYPVILPYHPTELTLKGDGVKINDNTFLMLRINGFSLPIDYPVHNIINEPVQNPEQFMSRESERNLPQLQNPQQKDDLPITGDNDPHHEVGQLYIRSEVKIIGPEPKIELFKKQKINNEPPKIVPLEKQKIEALSSGEQNYRKDSRGTGAVKQAPIKIGEDLNNIEWAIKELNDLTSDPKSDITGFAHIGNDGAEYAAPAFCYITESEMPQGHKRKWYFYNKSKKKNNEEESTKTNLRYRKFLIAKIALKDKQPIYLLEIEQKGSEAFSGLLFNISGDLSQQSIKDLLVAITNNEGRFRKREKGKLVPIDMPVKESFVFEHRTNTKLKQYILPNKDNS